jgi:HicB family
MKIAPHVDALRSDLSAAAGLGDARAAEVGAQLADAVARSAPLRFQAALGEALLEANEQLPSGHLELRLAGSDPGIVFVDDEAALVTGTRSVADEPSAARLTLRLPETLKAQLEAAAAREGVSLNTWLVRTLGGAVSRQTHRSGRRLVGYGRT